MLETIINVKPLHKKPPKILNYDLWNDLIISLEKCENLFNSVNIKIKLKTIYILKTSFKEWGFHLSKVSEKSWY